jgi:tyrosine-protein kinase Etk/Wzc
VLSAVSKFYLEKHMAVHRPRGQFQFFEDQVERSRRKLSEVQAKLTESARKSEIFVGPMELDLAVQKLADQRLALQQTHTAIGETEKRIAALESQLSSTPARMTTAVRTADNPELMVQLKATLLQLELKRTDLLEKFQPTHRNVQEVEQQIAQAQAAIRAAESAPVTDRTTDSDPTYQWMRSELAKAHTELISLHSRAASIAQYTAQYTERARTLSEGNREQEQWLSTVKALEDSYALYLRKREEARISDVLDQNQILNVSMAQLPSLPVLPTHAPMGIAIGAIFFALVLSAGTGFVSEYLDNSFRTPDEVQRYLDIPVIAALPIAEAENNGGLGARRAYEQIL